MFIDGEENGDWFTSFVYSFLNFYNERIIVKFDTIVFVDCLFIIFILALLLRLV